MPRGRGGFGGGHMMGGMPAEKPKNFGKTLRRLLRYLKPRGAALTLVFVLAILGTVFAIFAPKIMGGATTMIFEGVKARHVDFTSIWHMVLLLVGLYAASSLFSYLQQLIMAGVAQKTVYDMRRDVSEKLNRLPLSFFDGRTHGEIMSRVTNDVDNVATTLQQGLMQIITSLVTIVGIVIMMITISPLLTLIIAGVIPISILVTRLVAPRSQKHFAAQWKGLGALNGHVEEMYTGHAIVKAFGRERRSIEKFNAINGELYEASWRAQFISGLLMPLITFVNNVGYVAIAVVGGIMVMRNAIPIGDILAFISYSKQFTWPIAQTANMANVLQSTIASAERVFELLDEPEEAPDAATARTLTDPRGDVRFESVQFSYRTDEPLIEGMNIDVKAGHTIAIVGPTGAGKTTLVNLLMRFYEIQGGRISVDGVDIREFARGSYRRFFGMVLQDTWLFNGTIRENIAYGRENATDEEVRQAAIAAHADHFIRTLPDGYATMLNEEASNISQGQRQLITIARAVLVDPSILILDEATSSVDTRTEVLIRKAMAALMKGRTSFVIAHRLSTIRDAELILVMNHGRIVETGTHAELLARGGFYAELYNSQFSVASVEAEAV
ncbi:MAG TPA: ABC transporter ATP-binding protein [Spirochaetia bacterium]|nr:ABC transporter ATP-binding protein [Spirochaetia bacterium]